MEKNSNFILELFIVEKPGRHDFNQVIKLNIISNRTNQNCHLNTASHWWYSCQTQTYPNWRIFHKIMSWVFKSIKIMKVKERLKKHFWLKDPKEMGQLNAVYSLKCILWFFFFHYKGYYSPVLILPGFSIFFMTSDVN